VTPGVLTAIVEIDKCFSRFGCSVFRPPLPYEAMRARDWHGEYFHRLHCICFHDVAPVQDDRLRSASNVTLQSIERSCTYTFVYESGRMTAEQLPIILQHVPSRSTAAHFVSFLGDHSFAEARHESCSLDRLQRIGAVPGSHGVRTVFRTLTKRRRVVGFTAGCRERKQGSVACSTRPEPATGVRPA
jgi:hypothetical protein